MVLLRCVLVILNKVKDELRRRFGTSLGVLCLEQYLVREATSITYIGVFSYGTYTSVETDQELHLRVFEGADFILHGHKTVFCG